MLYVVAVHERDSGQSEWKSESTLAKALLYFEDRRRKSRHKFSDYHFAAILIFFLSAPLEK